MPLEPLSEWGAVWMNPSVIALILGMLMVTTPALSACGADQAGRPASERPNQPFGSGNTVNRRADAEVVVKFVPTVSSHTIQQISRSIGVQVDRVVRLTHDEKLYVVKVPADRTAGDVVKQLKAFNEVETAELNFEYRTH